MNKICNCCKENLPISSFYKDNRNKDGYNYKCKECVKKYRDKIGYDQSKYQKEYRNSVNGKKSMHKHRQSDKYKKTMNKYLAKVKKERRNEMNDLKKI